MFFFDSSASAFLFNGDFTIDSKILTYTREIQEVEANTWCRVYIDCCCRDQTTLIGEAVDEGKRKEPEAPRTVGVKNPVLFPTLGSPNARPALS